jgi:hypothetical protein
VFLFGTILEARKSLSGERRRDGRSPRLRSFVRCRRTANGRLSGIVLNLELGRSNPDDCLICGALFGRRHLQRVDIQSEQHTAQSDTSPHDFLERGHRQ